MKLDTVLADRYQICEQLIESVELKFLAQDLQTQNRVFIRILRFEDFEENELKLFEQEARTLQRLSHPAIPGYVDYFDVETAIPGCLDYCGAQIADIRGVALVQTYIEAPSLEDIVVVDGGKFSETEVIELADRLLSILIYLHEQNPPVIHCGINPRSILMTNRSSNSIGDVYLVNFGRVRVTAPQIGFGRLGPSYKECYLPHYYNRVSYEHRAITILDFYGLGMTMIYLLTGINPDELRDPGNGEVTFPPEISKNLHRWLDKMIQPNPFQPGDESKGFVLARSAQTELRSFNFRTSNLVDLGKRMFDNILGSFPR
jgi:serine/threonine protein kinase